MSASLHTAEDTWQGGVALAWKTSGLFLVVRGSPPGDGCIASREAIRAVGSELGEVLDARIRNHAIAHAGDEEGFVHRMTRQVASQMIAVLEQAHMRVRALQQLGFIEEIPAVCVAKIVERSREFHAQPRLFFIQGGGGQLFVQQGQRITEVSTSGVHFLDLRQGDRFVLLDRRTVEHSRHRMISILQSAQEDSLTKDSLIWELQRDRSFLADRPVHVLVHTV